MWANMLSQCDTVPSRRQLLQNVAATAGITLPDLVVAEAVTIEGGPEVERWLQAAGDAFVKHSH
jgi:hypothetical protein